MTKRHLAGRFTIGVLFFVATAVVGGWMGRHSWNGAIYLTNTSFTSNLRNPAAVHRDLDYTKLDGSELITGNQNRLISTAKVLIEKGEMGIELGHFVTRDEQGNRQLACEYYDRLRLRFEAEGVASSGERPQMTIEGPCRTGTDITRIEPVWVPVMKILSESPSDMDLNFAENEGVTFKFQNMMGEWPHRWQLTSLSVFNDAASGRSLTMSNVELRQATPKPLVLAWPSRDRLPTNAE